MPSTDPTQPRIVRARDAWSRARGMLFSPRVTWAGTWLVLERTHAIHTVLMRYPIDIAFCDRAGIVIDVLEGVPPGKFWISRPGAACVVERSAGGLGERWLATGERLASRE